MSYKITVYCNDEKIYKTFVDTTYPGNTYSGTYGSSALGKYNEFELSGVSGASTFRVKLETGCQFYRWAYRVGDVGADLQYSDYEEFTYYGESDIYIRAEGKSDYGEKPWQLLYSFNLKVQDPWYEYNAYPFYYDSNGEYVDGIGEYQLQCGSISFYRSGYVSIRSRGKIDVVGFLSDSSELSPDGSEPVSVLAFSDNNGYDSNFDIQCYVEADTEYYLFIRGATGAESGYTWIVTEAPWELDVSDYGTLSEGVSKNIYCEPLTLYRQALKFHKSGEVFIDIISDVVVAVYVNTSPEWDYRYAEPSEYDPEISTAGYDCSCNLKVEVGQQYYVWVRPDDHEASGMLNLRVSEVVPVEPEIDKWSWSSSNGSATKAQTSASYNAVNGNGATTNFHHKVWNDMVDKVKEILDYLGKSWNEYYGVDYEGTKMTEEPYELTAQKFNSLRYNIGSRYAAGTGIDEVSSGDEVLGRYFTTLAECINGWIDTL